jgi:hypothetical protein
VQRRSPTGEKWKKEASVRVIVHAGIGKAGSTAIQFWLGAQSAALEDLGVVSLRNGRTPGATSRWELTKSGSATSYQPVGAQAADPFADPEPFVRNILALARHVDTVVVSLESLYDRLYRGDESFLHFMREVAARFPTQLLIYVRPQHLWLEAAWRQWGFRRSIPASEWIVGHSRSIDYRWLTRLPEPLQGCAVRLHPVMGDSTERTDVVRHFATDVLGLSGRSDLLGSGRFGANLGLPLRICAALWRDPPKGIWSDVHDNLRLGALKRLLDDELRSIDRTDPVTHEVRHILHGWATGRFGEANEEFLTGLGWDHVGWPVPSAEHDSSVDLSTIDDLLRRDLPPTAATALAAHVERLAAIPDQDVRALL